VTEQVRQALLYTKNAWNEQASATCDQRKTDKLQLGADRLRQAPMQTEAEDV
jgi:hypothetical protein